ncbi:MAG: dihydropteroate synthase, partial [Rhodospirillales bacterium]|nr:dihydropteroate synthase [Rhodospirillales bacterium]
MFETLRLDAEEILFDADAVQASSLKRNAAARPKWYWLPRGGFESLIRIACQRQFWRDSQGLIARRWEKRTRVQARLDPYAPNPLETGRFIVNVTPDSFSDGGKFASERDAIAHCERLVGEGAHILDIGGESTRPGARTPSADEELARVLPVLRHALTLGVAVSVDTSQPLVMRAALDLGADIIN